MYHIHFDSHCKMMRTILANPIASSRRFLVLSLLYVFGLNAVGSNAAEISLESITAHAPPPENKVSNDVPTQYPLTNKLYKALPSLSLSEDRLAPRTPPATIEVFFPSGEEVALLQAGDHVLTVKPQNSLWESEPDCVAMFSPEPAPLDSSGKLVTPIKYKVFDVVLLKLNMVFLSV